MYNKKSWIYFYNIGISVLNNYNKITEFKT